MSDDRLATIRGLLAKAEGTPFPAEAEAFLAKATELMTRYAIDEAMLAADRPDGSGPGEVRLTLQRPYVAQKALLVNEVANRFGCRAIRFGAGPGAEVEVMSIVGFPVELEMVDTLVTSLLVQLGTSMMASQPQSSSASTTAAWRRSFIAGFVEAVGVRLGEQRNTVVADLSDRTDGSPSVALVLADRKVAVDEDFRRRHPRVRQVSVSVGSSWRGRESGRDAGRRADLGGRRLGGRLPLPR